MKGGNQPTGTLVSLKCVKGNEDQNNRVKVDKKNESSGDMINDAHTSTFEMGIDEGRRVEIPVIDVRERRDSCQSDNKARQQDKAKMGQDSKGREISSGKKRWGRGSELENRDRVMRRKEEYGFPFVLQRGEGGSY